MSVALRGRWRRCRVFSGRFRLRSRGAGRKRRSGAALEVGFEVGFEAGVLFGRQIAVTGAVDEGA